MVPSLIQYGQRKELEDIFDMFYNDGSVPIMEWFARTRMVLVEHFRCSGDPDIDRALDLLLTRLDHWRSEDDAKRQGFELRIFEALAGLKQALKEEGLADLAVQCHRLRIVFATHYCK